ncbi:MAG: radical SAM protein [Desulfobacterales bacterium]|nr:radical SAM protein [Desulfobacterales bacterium]
MDLDGLISPENSIALEREAVAFLAEYGTPDLLGGEWAGIFKGIDPGNRFGAMTAACGFERDPKGFFRGIGALISRAAARGKSARIIFNQVALPPLFLYHLLEKACPGQSLVTVKTVEKLGACTGGSVQAPGNIQKVLDLYPVRLSKHVIRQSLVSGAVATQYLPFADELDPLGHTLTFDGHFKQGLMEQMYRNRAIFLLDMRCPVYCRFCFRKHKSLRKEKSPARSDVEEAVAKVRNNKEIKEVLITGGEPLLNLNNMETALEGLMAVSHVRTLRIATRSLAYYPHLFLHHNRKVISYLKEKQERCREKGKTIEVGVHMVHPDEISVRTLDIISDLTSAGIPVYVQTPFLKGVNDTGPVLGRLFTLLRRAGAEIYYIFTPCHPIHGTKKYWSPISLSMEAYGYLRANVSDRSIPKLCTATPLGKMEWHTSGWAVEKDKSDPDHIWIRTPYTRAYFRKITGSDTLFPDVRENADATLDVKCLIDMGEPGLFLGSGNPVFSGAAVKNPTLEQVDIKEIRSGFYSRDPLMPVLVPGPCSGVSRVHKTRVETDVELPQAGLSYIASHREITDIVVKVDNRDGLESQIDKVRSLAGRLSVLEDRAFCIRLRWQAFQENPESFGPDQIASIRGMAGFSVTRPLRVEIETWWLDAGQVTRAHKSLGRRFLSAGIPVYANLALVSGLNDDPGRVAGLAHTLREAGMDFHHVYVAGLSLQNQLNGPCPINTDRILAIASHVRKVCSGREIPLYMIWTGLGEMDFGLTGIPVRTGRDKQPHVLVRACDRAYLEDVAPGVVSGNVVKEAGHGKTGKLYPCVPVSGLVPGDGLSF